MRSGEMDRKWAVNMWEFLSEYVKNVLSTNWVWIDSCHDTTIISTIFGYRNAFMTKSLAEPVQNGNDIFAAFSAKKINEPKLKCEREKWIEYTKYQMHLYSVSRQLVWISLAFSWIFSVKLYELKFNLLVNKIWQKFVFKYTKWTTE